MIHYQKFSSRHAIKINGSSKNKIYKFHNNSGRRNQTYMVLTSGRIADSAEIDLMATASRRRSIHKSFL